jgi:C-terminal processing protease CtpA/Prc
MASYLFADRTYFTAIWTRKTDQTREFWTEGQVPGNRYAKQPVFVLTSIRTFSGAEDFSYSLQQLKRAVIVGEVTGGGAHPVSGQPLGDGFNMGVPYAKTVNPITKSNWEGVGVAPDVKVAAPQALETAQKLAMEALGRK